MTVQYSKILPIITGTIFVLCLVFSFITNNATMTDLGLDASIITVSGGIFGSTIIWYMKKSQAENAYKLYMELYKTVASEKLKYNESMMKLNSEYGCTYDDSDDELDELMSSALDNVREQLDDSMNDANESVTINNY